MLPVGVRTPASTPGTGTSIGNAQYSRRHAVRIRIWVLGRNSNARPPRSSNPRRCRAARYSTAKLSKGPKSAGCLVRSYRARTGWPRAALHGDIVLRLAPAAVRRAVEKAIETPTINMNSGQMTYHVCTPSPYTCSSCGTTAFSARAHRRLSPALRPWLRRR